MVKEQVKSLLIRDKYFALVKDARAAAKIDIPDADLKKAVESADGE
jgi:peptidyl-prolyl cis-trans isomerase C